jgi:hypothetical protein
VVGRDVEELLGERGLRQLDTIETFTCVCGVRGSIADLVPHSVGFGEEQLANLCRAFLTPRTGA